MVVANTVGARGYLLNNTPELLMIRNSGLYRGAGVRTESQKSDLALIANATSFSRYSRLLQKVLKFKPMEWNDKRYVIQMQMDEYCNLQ